MGRTPSLRLWEDHHPCWVKTFQCGCFGVTCAPDSNPSPMLIKTVQWTDCFFGITHAPDSNPSSMLIKKTQWTHWLFAVIHAPASNPSPMLIKTAQWTLWFQVCPWVGLCFGLLLGSCEGGNRHCLHSPREDIFYFHQGSNSLGHGYNTLSSSLIFIGPENMSAIHLFIHPFPVCVLYTFILPWHMGMEDMCLPLLHSTRCLPELRARLVTREPVLLHPPQCWS